MQISLVKHGNSQALVIPKAILDLLNIGKNTKFELKTSDNKIQIESVSDRKDIILKSSLKMLDKYDSTFTNLANR